MIRSDYGCYKAPFLLFGHPYNYLFDRTLCLLYNYVTFLNKTEMTSTTAKRYTTTEYGKQNIFASEAPLQYEENYKGYWENAELLNGRLAMIGLFAAIHNYAIFGWVIPGIA